MRDGNGNRIEDKAEIAWGLLVALHAGVPLEHVLAAYDAMKSNGQEIKQAEHGAEIKSESNGRKTA